MNNPTTPQTVAPNNAGNPSLNSEEILENRRSRVRIYVTYIAAAYVFIGSAAFIGSLWIDELDLDKLNIAKEVFFTVLPIATGIITYWFASRKPKESNGSKPGD